MSNLKKTWSDCRVCGRRTRHEIISQHEEETDPDTYYQRDTWQIVRCLGCTTTGFLHRCDDFENAWQDHDGHIRHDVEINVFPRAISNHKKLSSLHLVPTLIRKAYIQTLSAYSEKAFVLASIGLRATIEAVCSHLSLSGNSLEKRIDQLFKGGYISNSDKKLLHAIRFLGNDAAHEIKEPKESELRVALEIIEHLLNSVFILAKKAKSLETVIETYEEFLTTVASCAKKHNGEQIFSLSTLLGRQRRLVGQNLESFESKIKSEIQSGDIKFLIMDKQEKIGGREVQLYSIGDISEIEICIESDDELPF